MIRAPSARACAANSPKYSGVACGKTTRCPDMLARPTFGSTASGAPTCISESARSAAVGPAPWFAPNAATSSARSRAAACAAETPASVSPAESKLMSATIGRLETERTRGDRRLEIVEVGERLDEEEIDAAALEQLRACSA